MNKNNYCVIMAGGIGSRFWPLSRNKKPKQFLYILGIGKTFLQQTFERFSKICLKENIYIVTNDIYTGLVAEQLPDIEAWQILAEPERRNTAPCIAYANFKIARLNPDANIVVAPSDHLILNESKFLEIIKRSFDFAKQNNGLLTLGITPSRPETGYGYIQISEETHIDFPEIRKVKTFAEKPDRNTAEAFIKSGEFYWNSGIFIWSLSSIKKAFDDYLPDISNLFEFDEELIKNQNEKKYIADTYAECRNISIDNGIMEHANNVYVLCTDFGWSDLGTWDSLHENSVKDSNNNVLFSKNIITYDTTNTIVNVPNDKLVVIQGIDNYIVAEADNILLICKKNDEKKIKQFLYDVKILKGDNFV